MKIRMIMINKNENDNDNANDTKKYSNWGYQDSFYFFMKDNLNVKNTNKNIEVTFNQIFLKKKTFK